jgi:general secretion pathway protein L
MDLLMRPQAIWTRWIELLAALGVGMREAWRARRALVLAFENKRLVIRGAPASSSPGEGPAELAAAARHHFVTLELPADEVVVQHISVPARAREFLSGVVHNQIERLSPWPTDQVVYGFDAAASAKDPETLEASVLIMPRANVERARSELAARGVTVDRIAVRVASGEAPVILWSRHELGAGSGPDRIRRMIGAALLAAVAVTAGVSAWSLISASAISSESEEVAERAASLQRQLQGTRPASGGAALDPAERAWSMKETMPSGMLLLETLSRALPDNAYLTELSLQKSVLRVVGLTSDAPALVAPLQEIGSLTEVHFFAPTTRGPDGRSYWFHIEARIDPQHARAEGEP